MKKFVGFLVVIVLLVGAWCAFSIYNYNSGPMDPTSLIDRLSVKTCILLAGHDPTSAMNNSLAFLNTWTD